jgi:hypothetical protein
MADNTTLPIGTGGDLISTDELLTRDGAAAVAGEKAQLIKPGFGAPNDIRSTSRQFPFPVDTDSRRLISYWGRACTFKTPGRAAVSQKILSIHNAVGSTVLVAVNRVRVDILSTAVKAVTIVMPVIRVVRYTTVQTNGTVLGKGSVDTALTSNASVTVTGDASADGTLSATTLTLTPTSTIAQGYAPRVFTAVGYELMDTITFFEGSTDVILRAGEGLAVFLDNAVVTTGIPATDIYISSIDWNEYTTPN